MQRSCFHRRRGFQSSFACLGIALLASSGCTSINQYVHNGFKLGPNYEEPAAPISPEWIDAANAKIKSVPSEQIAWWESFGDPVLNDLVKTGYSQNLTLQAAAMRVLEARAQQAIVIGQLFPQQQTANGSLQHVQASSNNANNPLKRNFNSWAGNLSASWELDFWGKIRRNIESATNLADASLDDYDNVMVSLIADVAASYVQYRVFEQQLLYTRENVRIQRNSLTIATERWKAGQTNEFAVVQAQSLLQQLESTIPVLEVGLRQTNNQLCVLLGIPPAELSAKLGKLPIPTAPAEIAVGIPADLIRRRPDLRAAQSLIAAQNAQIGAAEADLLPAIFVTGTIGYQAKESSLLFEPNSLAGSMGPGFQWNLLNYGRILNNVRLQDLKTQELILVYQQKVLSAAREVENGIVAFLQFKNEADSLAASVKAAERAVALATAQYSAGATDYTPVFVAQQFLAQQQVIYSQAVGDIAFGLISTYRALGGGWEVRLTQPPSFGQDQVAGQFCDQGFSSPFHATTASSLPMGNFASVRDGK